ADLPPAPFRERRHPRPRSRATVGRSGRRLLACNQLRLCLRNRRVFPRTRDRRSIQGARTTSRVLRRKTLSPENRPLPTTARPGFAVGGSMNKQRLLIGVPVVAALCVGGYLVWHNSVIGPCLRLAQGGFRPVAATRIERFLGKVQAATAACRGGDHALAFRA